LPTRLHIQTRYKDDGSFDKAFEQAQLLSEAKYVKSQIGNDIAVQMREAIAARFSAQAVGGSWDTDSFRRMVFENNRWGTLSDKSANANQILQFERLNKINDMLGNFKQAKSRFGSTKDKRSMGVAKELDGHSEGGDPAEEDQAKAYEMGDEQPSWNMGEMAKFMNIRPTREMFVDMVRSAIQSENTNSYIRQTAKGSEIVFHFGDASVMAKATALGPPIQQNTLEKYYGWRAASNMIGYYAWHIQEFGTATQSTSYIHPNVRREQYVWLAFLMYGKSKDTGKKIVVNTFVLHHPGRKGRHAYTDMDGIPYQSDQSRINKIVGEFLNKGK
jgi:hypothetical protein